MFIHDINPILLSVGPVSIHYYGLMYVIGAIVTYLLLRYFARQKKIDLSEAEVGDYLSWALLGLLIGARLGYALFYNLSAYVDDPLSILYIWKGGMSFHGGLIGGFLGAYLYCRRSKKNWLNVADMTVMPTALALALGRIGNLINGELYGSITSLPWGVNFGGEKDVGGNLVFRHPSQLYECAKNLLIFAGLWFAHKRKKYADGTLFFSFLIAYGVLRFLIEFIRMPDAQLGYLVFGLTMGQLLSIPLLLIGAYGIWRVSREERR